MKYDEMSRFSEEKRQTHSKASLQSRQQELAPTTACEADLAIQTLHQKYRFRQGRDT